MVSVPNAGAAPTGTHSTAGSTRSSPSATPASTSSKPKPKVNSNGYHPNNPQTPLSSLSSTALDLTSVERRGQPTAVREKTKESRPHGLQEAPTYRPTEEEWKDPFEYLRKITPEAKDFGICKIIPPDSWNPEFAIDTEKFHFRTRKQELNSVEGSTRANLTYLDGLSKFHKQHGTNLHRLPYVDKKPLDLYRLKKAVESRGGFEKVCKHKKWAEIGRDLGYSGKIMSSLSTSLKNSYQRWLCPYEEYLRLAKPGVHQQLEQEYGGPLTPSPGQTPVRRSNVNTPISVRGDSPARNASDALQATIGGIKAERDTPMDDAPPLSQAPTSGGFTAVNSGFTAVNSSFNGVKRSATSEPTSFTPDPKRHDSPTSSAKNTPDIRGSSLKPTALKRQLSGEESSDSGKKDMDMDDSEAASSRRSKRLKKDAVPTVAGSHMTPFRPSVPRIPREEPPPPGEKCETCGRSDNTLLLCESCDHAYHPGCLDPPLKREPDSEWNCARCLVGDGQFGFEEGGLYSLKQFQQKANDFKQGYFEKKMPFDHELNCHRPVTEEDVETEFWRLVADLEETVEVEYGADIHCTTHGSGFPTAERDPSNPYATDPWNLNVLPFHGESLFKHIKSDISGMTVPWVYVGMIFSTFCWHNEDHYAYSANYQHLGATKTWYGIPGEDAEKFENAMKEAVPELFETQPDLLFQLVTLLTPEQLKKAGVRVYALDQRAGQLVITFPQAYHAGFNHGFNFNEAVNFAPEEWEPYGLAGVERLQLFRRQPCFSHDELLWTAAESTASTLTIQTAKWLAPALDRIHKRELEQRADFIAKHVEAAPHRCESTGGDESCSLKFKIENEDLLDEDEQCCSYCKAFSYLSRFKCLQSGKVLCLLHAGYHACCEMTEQERFQGAEHILYFRKEKKDMEEIHQKVLEKAQTPDLWEQKYEKLLDEEPKPSLKSLRALLHEGERIPHDLPSLSVLQDFVNRCNDWVEEATNYIVRKQQNRRKNEKAWQSGMRKSIGNAEHDQKERESRNVSNIYRLLEEAERIGFDCPEILQLQERAEAIKQFQNNAIQTLKNTATLSTDRIEELLEEGRSFNVDTPEVDQLSKVLEQSRWNERARSNRGVYMTLKEVSDLIEEGSRLEIPPYNDHLTHYREQMISGQQWEHKAKELIAADFVHYPQLESLSAQVQLNALPVSQETLAAVDQILYKQREAHRQIVDLTTRCHDPDFRKRPKYGEVVEIQKKLEELNSKPNGTLDLENERKRHEDWMRRGKKLFGKSNAPLHILKSHLEYVLERNIDCFDIEHDTPRMPGEPVSREVSPEPGANKWDDSRSRQVFCICRKIEAGMMIECERCHEWYHYKCLKIARGKVKEDENYTCPICDWRMKIPRDASRPKLEDLVSLAEDMKQLPFQPDEEEVLMKIIENAENFRQHIARYCSGLLATEAEVETQRFYLRKIEGAEVLLAYETNFFRQELHKYSPVAPDPPPIQETSKSTRKPRPTKLEKMLAEYGVDNPDDLPEHVKGKANSLRRKAANAEAAAAAAANASSGTFPPPPPAAGGFGGAPYYSRPEGSPSTTGHAERRESHSSGHTRDNSINLDNGLHPGPLGVGGPQLAADVSSISLEDRLLQGQDDGINFHGDAEKSKALEILSRTELGRKQAERLWGPDVWGRGSISDNRRLSNPIDEDMMRQDEGNVDQMFKEMTNQDEDDDKRNDTGDVRMTTASLEKERNGMDALLDGE
ncbi:PLU-1-like protein-domain-containing protein [Fusarium flagelliforme]|uniref:Histone demethylase jarid1 n=1 Tax=Fusarium flagelliforme TaxID=2675880 RepID=A0A395N5I0_9HYPO|nr:PLU-1-like protein-domain-containing protein [Fusarium flagelliforme]KAH7191878.1 PLU-1-like protein-domain-containing protein [Fusarium flagelliforme]RFN55147.1 histone demethylase jarid1 [Fusarium flagelliforme]